MPRTCCATRSSSGRTSTTCRSRYFMNLGLPLLLGIWHGDIIGTVLLVGLLRLVVNHHVTFFINSLAHYWGTRPYTETNSARDNGFLAFLTYGEGYHNYHHIFQTDYRNGIRWWQWDPTKWMIALCQRLGLASNLNRVSNFKIQRAILDTAFERARNTTGAGARQRISARRTGTRIPAVHGFHQPMDRTSGGAL